MILKILLLYYFVLGIILYKNYISHIPFVTMSQYKLYLKNKWCLQNYLWTWKCSLLGILDIDNNIKMIVIFIFNCDGYIPSKFQGYIFLKWLYLKCIFIFNEDCRTFDIFTVLDTLRVCEIFLALRDIHQISYYCKHYLVSMILNIIAFIQRMY